MLLGREPRSQPPSHRSTERRQGCFCVSYRGVFPGVVVEDPAPTGVPVRPASHVVDLAVDHQPLVGLLIVSPDLFPAVRVEAASRHVTLAIILLLLPGDLGFPIWPRFAVDLMHLPWAWLTLASKAPIPLMLFFKLHCHRAPEISGLSPETSNPPHLWLAPTPTLSSCLIPLCRTLLFQPSFLLPNLRVSTPSAAHFSALTEADPPWDPGRLDLLSLWASWPLPAGWPLLASSIVKCPLLWPAPREEGLGSACCEFDSGKSSFSQLLFLPRAFKLVYKDFIFFLRKV